ncbi:MAG: hypothetical protein ACLTS6_12800 [Anaerobutyricum sp.]
MVGTTVLCLYLVTGCSSPSTSNSNVESSVSSEVIQSVSNSDSGEVSNDSQEEFESLKDEAENLFEEGKYKEAVVAYKGVPTCKIKMEKKKFPCV